jgi:hypothetical protein
MVYRTGVKTAGVVLGLLSWLLTARAASADRRDTGSARGTDLPLVILTQQGHDDTEDSAFLSSVRALAAEIGIIVTTEEVASFHAVRDVLLAEAGSQRKPFLVAWILREPDHRQIHLFDPWSNQLRTRSIEAGTSATANAEALALILRAELVAYLQEPPAPAPPAPAPPAPPPPTPPPPPAREPRWAASAAYALGTFLRGEGLQQGVRLGIEHLGPHLRLGVVYGLAPGQEVVRQTASVTVRRHPLEVHLGYASHGHGRLRWAAEALTAGDWLSRHTSTATAPLAAQADAGHFLVSVGARGRQEIRLFHQLALALALGVDVPLNPIDFQIVRGTTPETVARLSPVRLCAELGLEVSAF